MATIGDSASPSTNTIYYDALLSTTLFAYRDTLVDNIFKNSAFLAALRKADGIDYQDGGERIAMLLMYDDNSTVKSYQGYDAIDTTPQEGLTQAFYEWREIAGSISISRREQRQNSGEAKILGLLEQKTKQAEMTMKETVNKQLVQGTVSGGTFVPGNSAKDLNPFGYFARLVQATDPTAGGTCGNISSSSYSWWRTKTAKFGGSAANQDVFGLTITTYAGLKVGLRRLWNHCSKGADGSGPNLIISDQVTYETYENSLDANVRFLDTEMADLGFDSIKLKGATWVWDEQVPDLASGTVANTYGTVFMINTKFYKLIIDRETDFITTPFLENQQQTAMSAKVLFMGNAACSNMRKQGMGHTISLSIVA